MKKIKRFFVMLMISLVLVSTVSSDYQRAATVEASSFVYSAFEYMTLYFMSMAGYTPANHSDLTSLTSGFRKFLEKAGDLGVVDTAKIVLASNCAQFLDTLTIGSKLVINKDVYALKELWDLYFNGQLGVHGKLAQEALNADISGIYSSNLFSAKFLGGVRLSTSSSEYVSTEDYSFVGASQFEKGYLSFKRESGGIRYIYLLNMYSVANGSNYAYVEGNKLYVCSSSSGSYVSVPYVYFKYNEEGDFYYGVEFDIFSSRTLYTYDNRYCIPDNIISKNIFIGTKAESDFYNALEEEEPLTDYIYGSGNGILTLPDVLTMGNTSVVDDVSDTIAANPDMSITDLNASITAAITDALAAQQGVEDSIDTNTNVLSGLLSGIQSVVNKIYAALPAKSVISAMGLAIDNIDDNILDMLKDISTWYEDFVAHTVNISAWREDYNTHTANISTAFEDVIEGLLPVSTISNTVDDIKASVIGIPNTLSNVLDGVVALPTDVATAIDTTFAVDRTAVQTKAVDFSDVWTSKFKFLSDMQGMVDNFSFNDTYTYPIIEIQTPKIIKQFYAKDTIILFNGANFATHFVWVRNIFRAFLWLKFLFYLFKQFKVNLHIG